ncbi:predicted protein [Chaetomium globosum CBS 148.51]|uniref:Uncharacterized protein n=1 Tax=Chaetomium globosum (strain ATCC 6205 / CBS 148.51 / DSM 1962 / NBRC 6347 / NRRL 1970) TaxID=306901 RepID=Q2H9R5_CHAGB|nr:uncharacterized protein CHGG_03039 [Chaetomium globosum CBS 148.51]EAQ91104.1 predicted protein [Chaetomium globosum CBS 148.51]
MDGPSHTYTPTSQKLGPVRATTSLDEGTPQSASTMPQASGPFSRSDSSCDSPTTVSSTATTLHWRGRTDSTESAPASTEVLKRESSVSAKKVNANSYCGRHSKEFLFGGKGFGDLWRAVTRK